MVGDSESTQQQRLPLPGRGDAGARGRENCGTELGGTAAQRASSRSAAPAPAAARAPAPRPAPSRRGGTARGAPPARAADGRAAARLSRATPLRGEWQLNSKALLTEATGAWCKSPVLRTAASGGPPVSSKQALREVQAPGGCLLLSHPQMSFKNKRIQSLHFKVGFERHMCLCHQSRAKRSMAAGRSRSLGLAQRGPGGRRVPRHLHPPSHLHPPQHREGAAEAGASRTSGHRPPASTAHLAVIAWSETHPSALCDALSHRSCPRPCSPQGREGRGTWGRPAAQPAAAQRGLYQASVFGCCIPVQKQEGSFLTLQGTD